MKYIIDYTLAESYEFSEEKLAEIAAFGHVFDVVEITPEGEKYLNQNRTCIYHKHEHTKK